MVAERLIYMQPALQEEQLTVFDTTRPCYEILMSRERGKKFDVIDIDDIIIEVNIVDQEHVNELDESIFIGSKESAPLGQISPIVVAAKFNEQNKIEYHVTDGYHRTEVFKKRGKPNIEAIVLFGFNDEEIYDLRIMNAHMYKSTKYARIAEWMQRSFEQTKWFTVHNLSIAQAFALAVADSSGVKFQLKPQESEELKHWVTEKAKKWSRSMASIYQDLIVIEKADPELVRKVRIGSGGGHGEGAGIINPARFKAVVNNLPSDFVMQRVCADLVIQYDFDSKETDALARAIAEFKQDEDILQLVLENPKNAVPIVLSLPEKSHIWREMILVSTYHALDDVETELFAYLAAQVKDDLKKDRLYEDPRQFIPKQKEAEPGGNHKVKRIKNITTLDRSRVEGPDFSSDAGGYVKTRTAKNYEEEIAALKNIVAQLAKRTGTNNNGAEWWSTLPELSLPERNALCYLYDQHLPVKQAAGLMMMTEIQFIKLAKSGFRRYLVSYTETIEDELDRLLFGNETEKAKKSNQVS